MKRKAEEEAHILRGYAKGGRTVLVSSHVLAEVAQTVDHVLIIAKGRLVSLLEGWSMTKPGIFLYHPNRRQTPMPLQVFLRFVETWRKLPPRAAAT